MKKPLNPFITSGYLSPEYFCDREIESEKLIKELINGNNVALISTRRMGKTGLIQHCFSNPLIEQHYYTFFVDIYATKSLRDFVFSLSKVILEGLKPYGKKALEGFWNSLKSLQAGISFDASGVPSFHAQLGDIHAAENTLEEIFYYLEKAGKHCFVAIDEFQQIANYPEKNVEALLRTKIQHCKNANFIFAGSQRNTLGKMFTASSRPFYQSVSVMHLESINIDRYVDFACKHFKSYNRHIAPETVKSIYEMFDGITWYMQKVLNTLFIITAPNKQMNDGALEDAISSIIDSYKYAYQETLFRLPEKQKELLIAINKEGRATGITSGNFVHKYKLPSASSVQSAIKSLLEKDYITFEQGEYFIYDRFLGLWLKENF